MLHKMCFASVCPEAIQLELVRCEGYGIVQTCNLGGVVGDFTKFLFLAYLSIFLLIL